MKGLRNILPRLYVKIMKIKLTEIRFGNCRTFIYQPFSRSRPQPVTTHILLTGGGVVGKQIVLILSDKVAGGSILQFELFIQFFIFCENFLN